MNHAFHLSHHIAMPLTELAVLGCPMALRRPFFAEQTMGSLEPAKNRSTHSKGHPRQPLVLLDSKSQPDVTVQYSCGCPGPFSACAKGRELKNAGTAKMQRLEGPTFSQVRPFRGPQQDPILVLLGWLEA
jgi:hypothetical protein